MKSAKRIAAIEKLLSRGYKTVYSFSRVQHQPLTGKEINRLKLEKDRLVKLQGKTNWITYRYQQLPLVDGIDPELKEKLGKKFGFVRVNPAYNRKVHGGFEKVKHKLFPLAMK